MGVAAASAVIGSFSARTSASRAGSGTSIITRISTPSWPRRAARPRRVSSNRGSRYRTGTTTVTFTGGLEPSFGIGDHVRASLAAALSAQGRPPSGSQRGSFAHVPRIAGRVDEPRTDLQAGDPVHLEALLDVHELKEGHGGQDGRIRPADGGA